MKDESGTTTNEHGADDRYSAELDASSWSPRGADAASQPGGAARGPSAAVGGNSAALATDAAARAAAAGGYGGAAAQFGGGGAATTRLDGGYDAMTRAGGDDDVAPPRRSLTSGATRCARTVRARCARGTCGGWVSRRSSSSGATWCARAVRARYVRWVRFAAWPVCGGSRACAVARGRAHPVHVRPRAPGARAPRGCVRAHTGLMRGAGARPRAAGHQRHASAQVRGARSLRAAAAFLDLRADRRASPASRAARPRPAPPWPTAPAALTPAR